MVAQSLEGLAIKPGYTFLDCTVGGGGYFKKVAELLDDQSIAIGIDRDSEAIQWVRKISIDSPCDLILEQGKFSNFDLILQKYSIRKVNGILIDLGISSHQVDDISRGFAYSFNTHLDMRMNRLDKQTAEQLLASSSQSELLSIFKNYGEIRNPLRLVNTILEYLKYKSLKTSDDLKECLEKEYGSPLKYKLLAKVFQALRIAVNNEIEELQICLSKVITYLVQGGRLVVLTYHSLEDRIVKNFFRDKEKTCICPPQLPMCQCHNQPALRRINRKPYKASLKEIQKNNRARSARLRIVERL